MVLMLGGPAECTASRWHDVSGRIDAAAVTHCPRKHLVVSREAVIFEEDWPKRSLQQFPGLDLVEQLEQQDTKKDFARRTRQIGSIDDVPNKILAHPIRSPISISELIGHEHHVAGPRPGRAARS